MKNRANLLTFDGVSRTVLEDRIRRLVTAVESSAATTPSPTRTTPTRSRGWPRRSASAPTPWFWPICARCSASKARARVTTVDKRYRPQS